MKKEKRLTDNIYGENPIHVGAERITAIYEKCYALEDLMEKYDIKDLEELDKIVSQWKAMVEALEVSK